MAICLRKINTARFGALNSSLLSSLNNCRTTGTVTNELLNNKRLQPIPDVRK